jgi:tetratricopeptide (TPR) repeat protein
VTRFGKLELSDSAPPPRKRESEQTDGDKPQKRYKTSVEDWMLEADTHRRLGHYEEALRSYGRALEAERSHVAAWVGQAQMLIMLDETRQAEMWTISGLKVFPNNAELLAARSQAICRMGNVREAIQYNDAAIQGDGASAYRWLVRGELMTVSRSKNAEHCFSSAEQLDTNWLIRTEIANVLRYYHNPLKGLTHAVAAIQIENNAPFAWFVKGMCQFEAGFNSEAKESFQHALNLLPNFIEAREWLTKSENDVRIFKRILRWFWREKK